MTGLCPGSHTHTHTLNCSNNNTITICLHAILPPHKCSRMQSQIHGLPSRLAVPHCTYVCMCLWVYLDLFSLWISDFALFFFLCTHVGSVLEILRFVLCMSFACKCMCANAFIQRWQAVLNQVVFLTPDSQPLSFSLSSLCLIRLWDVKPRLSFEAIHTLHSNNVLLPCTPSSVSPSVLAFLNLTSPKIRFGFNIPPWHQYWFNTCHPSNSFPYHYNSFSFSHSPSLLLQSRFLSISPSLSQRRLTQSLLSERKQTDNPDSTTGWWPWISYRVKVRITKGNN